MADVFGAHGLTGQKIVGADHLGDDARLQVVHGYAGEPDADVAAAGPGERLFVALVVILLAAGLDLFELLVSVGAGGIFGVEIIAILCQAGEIAGSLVGVSFKLE